MMSKTIAIDRPVLVKFFLAAFAILALTSLRPVLFFSLPFLIFLYFYLFKSKFTESVFSLLLIIVVNTLISSFYTGEFNVGNNILSLYFIIPLLLIFFSRNKIKDYGYLPFLFKVMTIILIVNNCIAFLQFIQRPFDDDAFNGFYGTHGLGLHTLSLVNYIMSVYHFFLYRQFKLKRNAFLSLFFLISGVLCFYGLGLIVFLLSIFVFRLTFRNIVSTMLISGGLLVILIILLALFRPQTFSYNYENLRRATLFFKKDTSPEDNEKIPRKLLLYKNYVQVYSQDPGLLILGSGPGTFNSRSYFLLNGDYSKNKVLEKTLGVHNPKYAKKYVHTLWNKHNTGQFMDGTRNEPFSSVVALLAEYGALVFVILSILCFRKYKVIQELLKEAGHKFYLEYSLLKFTTIFMVLNLLTDNFLEYPEIILIYLLIFKFIEMSTLQISGSTVSQTVDNQEKISKV